jgi:hypothetical protein
MHAITIVTKMDPRHFERQQKELHERIVPMVSHQPGFVAATWSIDKAEGRSYSHIVLDSEQAATKLAAFVKENGSSADAGVTLEYVAVGLVLAEARRPS